MHNSLASAALLLVAGASAQTAPPRAPPTAPPATNCPMHDQAGGRMMQPGAMPMQHGQPMPETMEHCRTMHSPADGQQHMMHHPGGPPISQKQEKDQ